MEIYTPDEQLHRQHANLCQRDRFITRALGGHKPIDYKIFGREIETAIAARLRESGYSVSRMSANEHFDLLVNGLRVEVKAACASGHRYCAALLLQLDTAEAAARGGVLQSDLRRPT
jgi:hypothetical protein